MFILLIFCIYLFSLLKYYFAIQVCQLPSDLRLYREGASPGSPGAGHHHLEAPEDSERVAAGLRVLGLLQPGLVQ